MIELAQPSGVTIVGGDTTSAPHVAITVTLFASSSGQDKHILTRSAAKPGEKVAVTGELGAAAAGWEILTQKPRFAPEFTASLRSAFLRPHPRINEGQLLVEQGVKTAIDTSDGLISDLSHICKASHVSARIEADRVPIQSVLKTNFGGRALELALSGGEDYELLFTASAETITKVKMAASCPVTIIGDIIADKPGKITLVDSQGSPFNLHQAGWEHFGPRRQN
jgi:thiamine-monophosphate kinase